jgi:hypothetical protein
MRSTLTRTCVRSYMCTNKYTHICTCMYVRVRTYITAYPQIYTSTTAKTTTKTKQKNKGIRTTTDVGITDQHCALIVIPLYITKAPTCFGSYVSSSGSVLYPCELPESPKWLCHRGVLLYCKCWWHVCTGCCSFVRYFVQLGAASGVHSPPTFTVHVYILMTQTFLTFR